MPSAAPVSDHSRSSVMPSVSGHPDVEQHEIGRLRGTRRARRRRVLGQGNAIAFVFEDVAHRGPDVGLVVDDQDVGLVWCPASNAKKFRMDFAARPGARRRHSLRYGDDEQRSIAAKDAGII
jgi:hypothetical protein